MYSNTWTIASWAVLGALVGTMSHRLAQLSTLPSARRHRTFLILVSTLATSALFGGLAWRVGGHTELLAYSVLAAAAFPLSVIDIAEQRLPSRLVLPMYPLILFLLAGAAVKDDDATALVRAVTCMLVLPALYLALAVASGGGVGAGDVRLAGPVGSLLAWHGWTTVLTATVLALLLAAATGAALIVTKKATRSTTIPFGPAMLTGALATILLTQPDV